MTRNLKYTIALTTIAFLTVNAQAQTVIDGIQNSFNAYQQHALTEKLFLHTDKQTYLAGEILWFKAYDVNGLNNKPLNLSKVAYVELLDNNQNPVLQAKIALNNSSGNGSLYIPVSVNTGNYKLRAYTSWMKNFSPEYYFEKQLTIINPAKPVEATAKKVVANYDIQFFPEGGNLVNGMTSKVAFRAIGADAKGINFRGTIVDEHNDTVACFKPLKFGIGSFTFTPAADKTYKAIVYAGDGKPVIKDLPAVNNKGYVMHLTDNGSNIDVSVKSTNAEAGELYLFIETRQIIKMAKAAYLNNGEAHFTIDKNIPGDGISHITIFNNARQPVCERLYFKRPQQQLMLQAMADQQQYAIRKRVNVSVSAADGNNNPLSADISLSVYRLDSLQKTTDGDIFSYLWLNSDLRGYIESPGYYFNNNTPESNEAIDNLMLSQGWRRFEWNDVLNNRQPSFSFLPEINGHIITAKIIDITTNKPAPNVIAYLGVPGKRVQLTNAASDSTGKLLFNTTNFYGAGEIVAETDIQKDSTYHIDIQNPFSEKYAAAKPSPFVIPASAQTSLETLSLGMQVQNIYSGNKTRQFYNPLTDSSAFFGAPYKSYNLDDYTRFTTMEEVLREYVKEVFVAKIRGHFNIHVIDEKTVYQTNPLVILDGVPVFNMDKLFAVDPLKVKRLEVVRAKYFNRATVTDGILSFTTYKGDLGGYEIDPKAVVVDYEGLQEERKFYSPVYDTDQQAASRIPDFRNLLYWSPDVSTNKQGKAQATFYTSDETGQYIGVLQGISPSGLAGSKVFTFQVQAGYVASTKK